jgi:DNA-binding response OmpR family regulator
MADKGAAKVRILHVDDDPEIRLLMAGLLQELGHVVVTAGTIAEALQLAQEMRFDLFILDVRLPDGSGVELCQQLRKMQPDVCIAYYTAYTDDSSQHEALSICGDAYLKKPISMVEWEQTIAGLLHRKEK